VGEETKAKAAARAYNRTAEPPVVLILKISAVADMT
jgi:hypothetical protein